MHQLKGLLAHDEGQDVRRLHLLEQAAAIEPHDPHICADLALSYAEASRHAEALDVVAVALEHSPGPAWLTSVKEQVTEEAG